MHLGITGFRRQGDATSFFSGLVLGSKVVASASAMAGGGGGGHFIWQSEEGGECP